MTYSSVHVRQPDRYVATAILKGGISRYRYIHTPKSGSFKPLISTCFIIWLIRDQELFTE